MSTNGFTFPCTLHPNCQVNDAGVHIDVRLERSLQPLETPTTPEGWVGPSHGNNHGKLSKIFSQD